MNNNAQVKQIGAAPDSQRTVRIMSAERDRMRAELDDNKERNAVLRKHLKQFSYKSMAEKSELTEMQVKNIVSKYNASKSLC